MAVWRDHLYIGAVAVALAVAVSVDAAVSVALANSVVSWKNLQRTGAGACASRSLFRVLPIAGSYLTQGRTDLPEAGWGLCQ